MKRLLLLLPLTLLATTDSNTTQENNNTKPQKTDIGTIYLTHACNSCHGMYGGGIGANPRLQGVNAKKLLRRLKDLQAGKPRTAFGGIMVSFAQALDENQTIEMAEYLSTLKTEEPEEYYEDDFNDGSS